MKAKGIGLGLALVMLVPVTGCVAQSGLAQSSSEPAAMTEEVSREAHGLLRYPRICISVSGNTDDDVSLAPILSTEGKLTYRTAGEAAACFAGKGLEAAVALQLPGGQRKQMDASNHPLMPPQFAVCDTRLAEESRGLCGGKFSNDYSQGDEKTIAVTDVNGDEWLFRIKRNYDTEWIEFSVNLEAL